MSNLFSEAKKETGSSVGWNWIHNSPKWHYFVEGHSLCGRWFSLGLGNSCDDDPATDNSPDNCAACKRKIVKRRAKKSSVN